MQSKRRLGRRGSHTSDIAASRALAIWHVRRESLSLARLAHVSGISAPCLSFLVALSLSVYRPPPWLHFVYYSWASPLPVHVERARSSKSSKHPSVSEAPRSLLCHNPLPNKRRWLPLARLHSRSIRALASSMVPQYERCARHPSASVCCAVLDRPPLWHTTSCSPCPGPPLTAAPTNQRVA
jgi:hypothetical protein